MDLLEFTTLDEVGDEDAEDTHVDLTVQEEVDFMSLDEVGEDFSICIQEESTKPGNSTSNGKIALNTSITPKGKEIEKRSREHTGSRSTSREKKRNDCERKSIDVSNTSQLQKDWERKQPTREHDRKTLQQEKERERKLLNREHDRKTSQQKEYGRIQAAREHDRKTLHQEKERERKHLTREHETEYRQRGNTNSGDYVGKRAVKDTCTVSASSQSSNTTSRNPKWAASTSKISERDKKGIRERKDEEVSEIYRTAALAQNLLDSCRDAPLLGLQYVVEVRHNTNMTLEFCHFICVLCSKMVKPTMILDHAKSVPHQIKFMEIHQPQVIKKYMSSNLKDWTGSIMRDFTSAVAQMEAKMGRHRLAVTNGKGLSSTVASIRKKIRTEMLHHIPEPAEQTVKQEKWKPHSNLKDVRDTQERQRSRQSFRARKPESHPQHQHEMKSYQKPPPQHQHEIKSYQKPPPQHQHEMKTYQKPPPQHQHEMKSYQKPPPQHQHEMKSYQEPPPQHQHEMESYQEPPPQHQHELKSYQEPHNQDLHDRGPHIALYDVKKEGATLRPGHMEKHMDSNIFHRRSDMLRKNNLKDCNSTENVGPGDSSKDNVKISEDQCSVIGTLKILHELQDQVGSFGPAVSSLLEAATTIDQNGGRPLDLLKDPNNLDVVRFVIGKLLGQMCSGILGAVPRARTKMALERAMVLRFQAEKLLKEDPHSDTDTEHNNEPTPTVGSHDNERYSSPQGENNPVLPHAISGYDIPMKRTLGMSEAPHAVSGYDMPMKRRLSISEAPPHTSELLSVQASHAPRQNAVLDNNYLCQSSPNSLQCDYPGSSNFSYSTLDLQPNSYPAHSLDSSKPDFQQCEYPGSSFAYSSGFRAPQRSSPERIEHRFPDPLGPELPQGDYGHNYKLDPPQTPRGMYHQDHDTQLDEDNMDISSPKYDDIHGPQSKLSNKPAQSHCIVKQPWKQPNLNNVSKLWTVINRVTRMVHDYDARNVMDRINVAHSKQQYVLLQVEINRKKKCQILSDFVLNLTKDLRWSANHDGSRWTTVIQANQEQSARPEINMNEKLSPDMGRGKERSEGLQKAKRLEQTRGTSYLSGKKVDQKEKDTTDNKLHHRQSPNRRNKEDSVNKVQQRQQQRKEERAVDKEHGRTPPERQIEGTTGNKIYQRTARKTEMRRNTTEDTARKTEMRTNTAHKRGMGRNTASYTIKRGRLMGRNTTKYTIIHGRETGRNIRYNTAQGRTRRGRNTTKDTAHNFNITLGNNTNSAQDISDEEPGSPRRSWRFERESRH